MNLHRLEIALDWLKLIAIKQSHRFAMGAWQTKNPEDTLYPGDYEFPMAWHAFLGSGNQACPGGLIALCPKLQVEGMRAGKLTGEPFYAGRFGSPALAEFFDIPEREARSLVMDLTVPEFSDPTRNPYHRHTDTDAIRLSEVVRVLGRLIDKGVCCGD